MNQPRRAAFQIFDDKVKHLLRDEYPDCPVHDGGSEHD